MEGKFSDYVIWWIVVAVLVELAFAVQSGCPAEFNGLLAIPLHSNQFLRCEDGTASVMKCNAGTAFNPEKGTCNSPPNAPGSKVHRLTRRNIQAGAGFSGDIQRVTAQKCYDVEPSYTTAQQGRMQLSLAVSSEELERVFGVDLEVEGGFAMLSANAAADYLRSVKETENSVSLNYYMYTVSTVAVQIAGYGENALSQSGKDLYQNGSNPYFGLVCGDYFISEFKEGAFLTMGLIIKLSGSNVKNKFNAKVGGGFGDIIKVSAAVKSFCTENNVVATITIQAFQMGGDSTKLSQILAKDSSGNYYGLTCNVDAMDKCSQAVSGLLDYAKENFQTQFSIEKQTGLMPLGIGYVHYDPIKWLGLRPPASLITEEVEQYREELNRQLTVNKEHQGTLETFLGKQILAESEELAKKANRLLSKVKNNLDLLMRRNEGASDCFNLPYLCKKVKAVMDSNLHNITDNDVQLIESIKNISSVALKFIE